MHSLSDADTGAVQTWARTEATAELYAILIRAIYSTSRSADEQNAVDWLKTIAQRRSIESAQNAGREYVKWAGLSQSYYQSLLKSGASESTLETFLKGTPVNYNLIDSSPHDEGKCDACGGKLVQREDDTEQALAVRLKDYHSKTNPVLDIFRRKEYVVSVDARADKELVQQEIRSALNLPHRQAGRR